MTIGMNAEMSYGRWYFRYLGDQENIEEPLINPAKSSQKSSKAQRL